MCTEPLYSTSAIPEIQHHSHPHSHPHPHHPTDLIDSFSETDSDDPQDYPSLISCAIAGGIGGMVGDTSMHSLDTVKTRQQGAPQILKYKNTFKAYKNIFIEEGIRKGLYGGYNAAMLGSFPSSAVFFFTYEYVKRLGIDDYDMNETLTFLGAGFVGDFVSSIFYVPSEVLKTRLQLQGRHNNPHFKSGYNYFNTFNAVTTIIKTEGWKTLFFGYKATLIRDLPFSALQFTFYEKFRLWAYDITGTNKSKDNLPLVAELVTGAGAGGLAGMITTPLDVVKTRMQTQNGNSGNIMLSSSSTIKNLSTIYSSQGTLGLFSGVGPRFVWTSIQSSVMLLLYQVCLRALNTGEVTLE